MKCYEAVEMSLELCLTLQLLACAVGDSTEVRRLLMKAERDYRSALKEIDLDIDAWGSGEEVDKIVRKRRSGKKRR